MKETRYYCIFFYKTESKGKHLCASITESNTIHTRDTLTSWSALLHKPIMQSWNYKLRFHFIFFVFINVDWLPILLQISLLDGHCVYKMFGLLIHFHGCGLNWGFIIFFIILFLGRIENLYHVVCSCSPICLPPSSCSFCLFVIENLLSLVSVTNMCTIMEPSIMAWKTC